MVAQLVEQWPFKPTVAGSIPAHPTMLKQVGSSRYSNRASLRDARLVLWGNLNFWIQ